MIILGIETSCDDTGIAIVKTSDKTGSTFDILSNIVSSQIKVHSKYGGIVPNLAAREHLKNIEPSIKRAFKKVKIKPEQIDLIAVTAGPGLIPALLVGVNFAKTLAYVWKKPIVGVNHIEGHIIAGLISSNRKIYNFPAIALVVSGGHTQLVLVKKIGDYKIIGETRDDAAGECFDKVAKLLGLGYPGGPEIAAEAAKVNFLASQTDLSRQRAGKFQLPRPMIRQKNYDFSFSGLKTAVFYLLKDIKQKSPIFSDRNKRGIIVQEICAEVQQAIIDVLIEKTMRAAIEYKAKTIILSGGVAANEELRNQFKLKIVNCKLPASPAGRKIDFLVPPKNLCTDNGVMIAMTGYLNYKQGAKTDWRKIKADPNLQIGN